MAEMPGPPHKDGQEEGKAAHAEEAPNGDATEDQQQPGDRRLEFLGESKAHRGTLITATLIFLSAAIEGF